MFLFWKPYPYTANNEIHIFLWIYAYNKQTNVWQWGKKIKLKQKV